MNMPSASDFPQVYEFLGIDTGRLGCIMLNVDPLIVHDVIPLADLYEQKAAHDFQKGYISEQTPHLTLLYGLLRSGQELKPHVDMVLKGWKPDDIEIEHVDFFYGDDDGTQYITIAALVNPTDSLREANSRLRLLPHIDTFSDYKPHITLAYVKAESEWNEYINDLDELFAGKKLAVVGLNYGE